MFRSIRSPEVLLSHQVGGFLGAYLGGLTISRFGDFGWMWYADIALSLLAAILNLPIREARIERPIIAAQLAPVASKGSIA